MKNKRILLTILFTTIILTVITAISYAYFFADPETRDQELVIEAGTMQMRFSDNDAGINTNLNFGESVTKEFILENTGTLDTKAKITFTNMINTYLAKSLTYKLEYKTSKESTDYIVAQVIKNVPRSEVASTQTLANNLDVPVGSKYYYKLTVTLVHLEGTDQTDDINSMFTTTFGIEEASESPFDKVIASAKEGNPNFAKPAVTDEGVYAMVDDYGTSYYYRGAVNNNYIKFGKFGKDVYFGNARNIHEKRYVTYNSLEECNNGFQNDYKTNCRVGIAEGTEMWWRIVRINGDGSLRIIYDGTQGYANGAGHLERYAMTFQQLNAKYDDAKYVGWMFGGTQGEASTSKEQAQTNETNSDAKTAVDNWYKENIVDTGYAGNVVDRVFCNDRSIILGTGYGKASWLRYGATKRLSENSTQPKFTCDTKNDAFTVKETKLTNGDLTYPIGLITADEMVAAGTGAINTSGASLSCTNHYLYKSSLSWNLSLTPYGSIGSSAMVGVIGVDTKGLLNTTFTSFPYAIAPVINLSAEYAQTLIGDGTITNPYRERGTEV